MRFRRNWAPWAGVVLGLPVALAGCSSDDGGAAAADITVTASEYEFSPTTWTVEAGEFTVSFSNEGTIQHEWAVIKLDEDISSGADFAEDKVLLEIEAVPAGESTLEDLTIDVPGTYQVICGLDGHFDQGMEGTLTVG